VTTEEKGDHPGVSHAPGRSFGDWPRRFKPIEEVARFLVGTRDAAKHVRVIIDSGHRRDRDLALEISDAPLEAVMSAEVWNQV
jgi:hypothetical protein